MENEGNEEDSNSGSDSESEENEREELIRTIIRASLLWGNVELFNMLLEKHNITKEYLNIIPRLSNFEVTYKLLSVYFSNNFNEITNYVLEKKLLLHYVANNRVPLAE